MKETDLRRYRPLDSLLQKHASRPYNPHIANVFYLAGFIESWGRGIEKINNACDENGVPRAEYYIKPGDIMVKFTAPEDLVVRVTDKVTDREKQLMEIIAEDPGYSMVAMAKIMNVSRKSVAAYLKSLKEKGVIEREGSDRKGYWKFI